MMSGGPIDRFKEGWAVSIAGGFGSHPKKAHYYTRDDLSWADALCGAASVKAGALRGLGNWATCQRCEAALKRREAKMKPCA